MHDNKTKKRITIGLIALSSIGILFIVYRLWIVSDPILPDWEPLTAEDTYDMKEAITYPLSFAFVHCTANRPKSNITKKNGKAYLWGEAQKRGFHTYGYNFVVYENGQSDTLIPINRNTLVEPNERACGVRGYNKISIHVAYVGGLNSLGYPTNTLTIPASHELQRILDEIKEISPKTMICPHNKYSYQKKACPSFNFKCY